MPSTSAPDDAQQHAIVLGVETENLELVVTRVLYTRISYLSVVTYPVSATSAFVYSLATP